MPTALRKWINTMIIGYLTHDVPCQIGDASTLWGPGLLNHEGTCRLQRICNHIYVSEIDTWHHWCRWIITHKSWTRDASNKPKKYALIGFDCYNWHIEIGDKPSSAPMLTGQYMDDAYMRQLIWISLHQVMACRPIGLHWLGLDIKDPCYSPVARGNHRWPWFPHTKGQ